MPVSPNDKPVTAAAIQYIEGRWNITAKGWRAVGPGGDHPRGLAVDAITANKQTGDEIANWGLSHPDTRIVIWQGKGAFPAEGGRWRNCTGCAGHYDHVHISFLGNINPDLGAGGVSPVNQISGTQKSDGLSKSVSFITDPHNWFRIGLFLGGLGLVILAIITMGGDAIIKIAVKKIDKVVS